MKNTKLYTREAAYRKIDVTLNKKIEALQEQGYHINPVSMRTLGFSWEMSGIKDGQHPIGMIDLVKQDDSEIIRFVLLDSHLEHTYWLGTYRYKKGVDYDRYCDPDEKRLWLAEDNRVPDEEVVVKYKAAA